MAHHDAYNTPYIDLLPPLSTDEFASLRDDIATHGQRVPIMVMPDGTVIDGHHRLKVCQELGLVPLVDVVETDQPEALAIKANLVRRNLSPDQQAVIRRRQQELAYAMAQDGMTQAEIGTALGVSRRTVGLWVETNGNAAKGFHPDNRVKLPKGAAAEIVERIDAGESLRQVAADYGITHTAVRKAVNKAKAAAQEAAARQADAGTIQPDAQGDRWKMLHGDFRERLADLADGSVDLIVTDPPYPAEFLPLWSDLSETAARILKPGGILLAMSGKIHLDQVMRRLGSHLQYGWVYVEPTPVSPTRILARHTLQTWKPWLAYSNGPWPSGRIDWHPDTLEGASRSKETYRWQQATGPICELLEYLSQPNDLIVDPFTGTGTTGFATIQSGRRFLGVELDQHRFTDCVQSLNDRGDNADPT